jgi:hypothetical protein
MDPRALFLPRSFSSAYPDDFTAGPPVPEPRRDTPIFFGTGTDDAPPAPVPAPFNTHADVHRAPRR